MRIRRKMEKEKEEDIWSRKIIGWQWRRKTIFREGKYLFFQRKKENNKQLKLRSEWRYSGAVRRTTRGSGARGAVLVNARAPHQPLKVFS